MAPDGHAEIGYKITGICSAVNTLPAPSTATPTQHLHSVLVRMQPWGHPSQPQPCTLMGLCGTPLPPSAHSPWDPGVLALPMPWSQPWSSELRLPPTPRCHWEHRPTSIWIWGSEGAPILVWSSLLTPVVSALPRQCFTIEKLGRRPLIITGFCAMGICSAGITVSLLLQVRSGYHHHPGPLTWPGLDPWVH